MRATVDENDSDLLARFRMFFVAGVLGFRGLFAVPPLVMLVAYHGLGTVAAIAVIWVVVVAVNVALVPLALRRLPATRVVLRWLALDAVVGVTINLVGVPLAPGPVNDPYQDVFWFWCMGSVVLWTACFGARGGVLALLATVPLQLAMTALSDPQPVTEIVPMVIGRTVWLLAGVLVGVLILVVMRLVTGSALVLGERTGRQSEQIRMLRRLHDTALQTFEAIGLGAEEERGDAASRLRSIGEAARIQALEIRTALTADEAAATDEREDPAPGIDRAIEISTPTLRRAGVQVRVLDRPLAGITVPGRSAEALRSALREALTNVRRHATASTAEVRAAALPDRLEVVVRDDGRGIDAGRPDGFGIRSSIKGRLEEAGGGAIVSSGPTGTTVRMWVPR